MKNTIFLLLSLVFWGIQNTNVNSAQDLKICSQVISDEPLYVLKTVSPQERKNYTKTPLNTLFFPFKIPEVFTPEIKTTLAIRFIPGEHPRTFAQATTILNYLIQRDQALLQRREGFISLGLPNMTKKTIYEALRHKLKKEETFPNLAQLTEKLPLIVQHGDFHSGNILLKGEDIYLIDFDNIGLMPLGWDAIVFFAGASLASENPLSREEGRALFDLYRQAFPEFSKELLTSFETTYSLFSMGLSSTRKSQVLQKGTLRELGLCASNESFFPTELFQIKVATFNPEWLFENLPEDAKCENWVTASQKFPLIEKYLPIPSLDFIGIQELECADLLERFFKREDSSGKSESSLGQWSFLVSDACRYKQRTGILYRSDHWNLLAQTKIAGAPKIVHGRFASKVNSRAVIDLYCVHLASRVFETSKKVLRTKICQGLISHQKKIALKESQVLIMGDFNDVDEEGTCLQALQKGFKLNGSASVLPEGSASLYSTRRQQSVLVDHVISSGQILEAQLLDAVPWSDHKALLATVQFGKKKDLCPVVVQS